jgi:2'-5' RNA ligase
MRCFVAIELGERVRESLDTIQSRLRQDCPDLSWVRPASIHLTLKFIGEIEAEQADKVRAALDGVAAKLLPFEFEVGGLGTFPPGGRVSVVWVGVEEPLGMLMSCQRECESALAAIGFAAEDRPFHPHLTLARNKKPGLSEKIRGVIAKCEGPRAVRQTAAAVTFSQSHLGQAGSRYEVLSLHAFTSDRLHRQVP